MHTSSRLSVADARAIIGLPGARGSATIASDASSFEREYASRTLGGSMLPPTRELGSTLKSRFAAIARKNGASHKETRGRGRSLVGRRANLEEGRPYDRDGNGPSAEERRALSLPIQRFQKTGRRVVRQCLERSLELAPINKERLGRLGSLELMDGDLESAVEHLRLATKGSNDDAAWVALARAEVRLWERDPAIGHEHLRCACDAYRHSIDLLEPGFVQALELPTRLLELGGVYESFGSFEGALYIYQRTASSMPLSSGFEDVLFRCAVVMRYMSTLERAPRESLLQSALEHLDLILQEQTMRKGRSVQTAWLLYADICLSLGEGSAVAKAWAKSAYQEVFNNRQRQGDTNAMAFGDWDDWIASPDTQLQFAKEWGERGEPALAFLAFEKSIKAFDLENETSPGSTAGPPFDALMDASEALASFQRFSRAEGLVRKALELEPENEEAKCLLREFLGDENCLRREMGLQVVLHLQSKWRTRIWQGQYLLYLRNRLQTMLEERLAKNRLDVEAREQLGYFFRDKHRPVLLFEDRCARVIQRLGRAGLFRLRWFKVKQRAYRKELTNALKLWQKSGYTAESRQIIRARAASRYAPATHKIVSVVELMRRQDEAAPFIQRAARNLLARKMFRKILKNRSRDLRRKMKAVVVHVQCQMRRYLARRELDRRVKLAAERTRAASFIQHAYRARTLQWGYAIAKAQRAREREIAEAKLGAAGKLQATWRMKLGGNVANRRRRAIVDIQRSSRAFLTRKHAGARKNRLVTRMQRQYRRHLERFAILRALMAMRISRELREARAKEVERRFRAMEEERPLGGTGGGAAITPLEARRAARANQRLLERMQAKGSCVLRARKWRLQQQQQASKSPLPPKAPASAPAPSVPAPSSPGPSPSSSAATLPASIDSRDSRDSRDDNDTPSRGRTPPTPGTEDVGDDITPLGSDGSEVHPPVDAEAPPPAETACHHDDDDHHHHHPPPCRVTTATATATGTATGTATTWGTGIPGSAAVEGEPVPTCDCPPAPLLEEEASASSGDKVGAPATETSRRHLLQSPGPALLASTRPSPPSGNVNGCVERDPSPPPTSPALAAALTCAHGIGGRLGTPLGSPFPASAEGWVAGRSASAFARATAARTATGPGGGGGMKPSAPGSHFFPPFVSAGASGEAVSVSSPVVFEMVQDAADDEENVAAAAAAAAVGVADNGVAGRGAGWHGLMLYRRPGISHKSPVFQQAIQLATIAFSPDVRHPPPPSSPALAFSLPCLGSTSDRADESRCLKPTLTTTAALDGPLPSSARRARTLYIRRQGGPAHLAGRKKGRSGFDLKTRPQLLGDFTLVRTPGREKQVARVKVKTSSGGNLAPVVRSLTPPPAPLKMTAGVDVDGTISMTPASMLAALQPARVFDSGDMMMAAGLLGHPESSLKRLVLHRARINTAAGREAFLRCLAINKLGCLALGACTWLEDAGANKPENARQQELQSGRWWEEVCDTIRTKAFRLQELVVEGLDQGGDALGNALGVTLDDYFVNRFGNLSSIVVVRCKISDEGAVAIARGIYASNTLAHVDLSANKISDVGVEALAKVLVGEYPGGRDDGDAEQDAKSHGNEQLVIHHHEEGWPCRRAPVLKTLDLGQNRMMDPGGQALAAALPRSMSLESLTVSHNFMMEDAAQALLAGAAASQATLRDIHCEGNLFGNDMCGRIALTLMHRHRDTARRPPTPVMQTPRPRGS